MLIICHCCIIITANQLFCLVYNYRWCYIVVEGAILEPSACILTHLSIASFLGDIDKQCRTRSDAVACYIVVVGAILKPSACNVTRLSIASFSGGHRQTVQNQIGRHGV